MTGTCALRQPCLGVFLLSSVSPAGSASAPPPLALGSCGLPCIVLSGKRRDRPAARAQLRTLGGLEDLRGFPRGMLASSCSPLVGSLCRPLPGLRADLTDWPRGMAQLPDPALPVTGFQARRGRGWGSSQGGRQLVRATCKRGSWSPALCSVPPGDEALLSLRWWQGGGSLLLSLLSSRTLCENPLNKKNLISINTAYT